MFSRRTRILAVLFSAHMLCSAVQRLWAANEENVPPFTAKVRIVREHFQSDAVEPFLVIRSEAYFAYSNRWWEIEWRPEPSERFPSQYENWRRIPGGTRSFSVSKDDKSVNVSKDHRTLATATSWEFPNFQLIDVFSCWLAFLPRPDLPFLDDTKMERLLNLEYFGNADNQGYYAIKFLDDQQTFLSQLIITNNGILFADGGKSRIHLSAPFDKGFVEFNYEVLESTNYYGFQFPQKAVLRQLRPKRNAKSLGDLGDVVKVEVALTSLEKTIKSFSIPSVMAVADQRSQELRGTNRIGFVPYLVTNDTWVAITDKQMSGYISLAKRIKPQPTSGDDYSVNRKGKYVLLAMIVCAFAPIFLLVKHKKQKHKS